MSHITLDERVAAIFDDRAVKIPDKALTDKEGTIALAMLDLEVFEKLCGDLEYPNQASKDRDFCVVSTIVRSYVATWRDAFGDEDPEPAAEEERTNTQEVLQSSVVQSSYKDAGQDHVKCVIVSRWSSNPTDGQAASLNAIQDTGKIVLEKFRPNEAKEVECRVATGAGSAGFAGEVHRVWPKDVLDLIYGAEMFLVMSRQGFVTDVKTWKQVVEKMLDIAEIFITYKLGQTVNTSKKQFKEHLLTYPSGKKGIEAIDNFISNLVNSQAARWLKQRGARVSEDNQRTTWFSPVLTQVSTAIGLPPLVGHTYQLKCECDKVVHFKNLWHLADHHLVCHEKCPHASLDALRAANQLLPDGHPLKLDKGELIDFHQAWTRGEHLDLPETLKLAFPKPNPSATSTHKAVQYLTYTAGKGRQGLNETERFRPEVLKFGCAMSSHPGDCQNRNLTLNSTPEAIVDHIWNHHRGKPRPKELEKLKQACPWHPLCLINPADQSKEDMEKHWYKHDRALQKAGLGTPRVVSRLDEVQGQSPEDSRVLKRARKE